MNTNHPSAKVALGETFRLALDALRAHKLRSFLTLLGIILAVMTLVGVMSVVAGLNLYISDKVANLGANAFVVDRFGIITNYDDFLKARKRPMLTYEDLQAVIDGAKIVEQAAAEEGTTLDVHSGNQLVEDVSIQGVTPNFMEIRNMSIDRGRMLNDSDEDHRSPVCIIGADIATKLFSNTDPIGKAVRAGPREFQVVGVATARGTVFGQPQDLFVMVPYHSYEKSWHTSQNSLDMFVQSRTPDSMDAAEDEVRTILRSRHHEKYNDPDDFGIIAPNSIMGLWEDLTGQIFRMAIGLTMVFLVVGGIVIMNIMLASVTERTREIGIRKALGARKTHIVMQFLVEAAVLAAVGGAIGIGMAYSITWFVRTVLEFPMSTPMSAVILSLILSTGVGLFFGIYPAMRAARLDPIEALRAET